MVVVLLQHFTDKAAQIQTAQEAANSAETKIKGVSLGWVPQNP